MIDTIQKALGGTATRQPGSRTRLPRAWAAVTAAVVLLLAAACSGGIPAGEPAPELDLVLFGNANNTAGEAVKLADFEGTPTVLNFWYPSCGPCRVEMPDFEEASHKYDDDDLKFLAVQVPGFDSAEDGQAFVDELGLTFSVGHTESAQIVMDYKVIGFPSTVFLNGNHEIVRTWSGALDAEKLEELIQELIQ
jgi:thiol-disulfide isomerase/thioredoxin